MLLPRERDRLALEIVLIALAPLAGAALAASFLWSVEAMGAGAPWRLLGVEPVPCPGCAVCGMSRAFTAASHGELARALEFNPLVALIYPAFWATALAGPLVAARRLVPFVSRSSACRPLR